MIININSFPKIQIILIFFLILLLSCTSDKPDVLDNEKFIEIYARLLIISEMDISKEYQDKLIGEVYRDFSVSAADIDSSMAYLNANPDKWVDVLDKARDKIQEIRKEMVSEEKEPQKIVAPKRSPAIRDIDKEETRQRRLRDKPSRDKTHPREKKKDLRE